MNPNRTGIDVLDEAIIKAWMRKATLKFHFGMTLEDYDLKLQSQQGLCAVCQKPETDIDKRTGLVRRLSVDHNHQTGQIRKLLCSGCNMALGYIRENAATAYALGRYIEDNEQESSSQNTSEAECS
jgi:hypothetical protein